MKETASITRNKCNQLVEFIARVLICLFWSLSCVVNNIHLSLAALARDLR